jgi:hypothetical protein
MNSGFRFVPALLIALVPVVACSSGDDDGTGTGGAAGSGGATGGSSGKGGSGGSAGTGTGGSAGTGTGGSAGAASGISADCRAWCVAQDHCRTDSTVDDCMEYTCTTRAITPTGNIADAPVACQNAWKGFWQCLIGSGDPCTLPGPCETQAGAIGTSCQ